ncbi:MAG: sugar phosphate isomerase/epimerase [Planctomycetes bacterium]|nr:sugar phosphate isomerase/epimerase [Planctomycetota bacterium]
MIPGITTIAFRNTPLYLEEILPKVSAAGYKSLEIWHGHVENRDDHEMPVVAELAEREGLGLSMVSCYPGTFNLDMTNMAEELAKAEFAAEMARMLGVKYVRAFAGWVMECSSRDASPAYWKYCTDGMKEIAAICRDKGLQVAVETHKLSLADTVAGCKRLIDETGADSVRLNLQLDGPAETDGRKPVAVWNELKEHVVHFHQPPGIAPWTIDELKELFAGMRADGYEGAVSIEGCSKNVMPAPVMLTGMELLKEAGVV